MNKLHICCLLAVTAMLAKTHAQSALVDFNTAGDLANNFNIFQNASPATGNPYSQSASGGVGNSGSVAVSATGTVDSTEIYKNASFDFSSSGKALTISSALKVIPIVENGNRLLQLGFVNENTSGLNGNPSFAVPAPFAFTSMRFNPGAVGSTIFSPQWQTKTAAGGTVNTAGTIGGNASATLVNGEWYLMSLTFVNAGAGSIQASGFLQDLGADGLTPGASLALGNITLTSADIAADGTVFPALRGFAGDGLGGLDNFQAVPEPSTLALFAAAGAAGVVLRRRKK